MHHEYDTYLLPLLILCGIGLFSQLRIGWRWIGFNVCALLLPMALALAAYFSDYGDYFMPAAWVVFVSYVAYWTYWAAQANRNYLNSNMMRARAATERLHLVQWGKPFQMRRDTMEAADRYMNGRSDEGDALLRKWDCPSTPKIMKDRIPAQYILGPLGKRDWDAVIARVTELTANAPDGDLFQLGARAQAEKGNIREAVNYFERLKTSETSPTLLSSMAVLPVVALSGDVERCDKLLRELTASSERMPQHAVKYWQARCRAANGDLEGAEKLLSEGLKLVERDAEFAIWKQRFEYYLERVQNNEVVPPTEDGSATLEPLWTMYADSVKARRLIAPAAISKTSVGIIIGISLIFAIERLMTLYGDEQGILTVQKVLTATMLDPQQVLNGQYYRLVTYMLLHKDEFHLFVNMVGLYIFAKRAQNIFGTLPMLVIFVMSGIAGGVMHTFFDSQTLSIGASGGLMGIFGAVIVGTFRVRSQLPEALAKQQLKLMIVLAAFGLVLDHIIPQVATWVHIGGLICGVALGFMFPIGKNPEL